MRKRDTDVDRECVRIHGQRSGCLRRVRGAGKLQRELTS